MHIEDFLQIHANACGDRVAVVCDNVSYTYSTLYRLVEERKKKYTDITGKAIALRATPSIDFIIDYFAIHQAGCVAVPLDAAFPSQAFTDLSDALMSAPMEASIADILFTTGTTGRQKGVMISHDAILADAENLADAQQFSPELTYIICGPLNHIGSLSKIYPSLMVGATIVIVDGLKDMNPFFHSIEQRPYKVATFLVPVQIRMILALARLQLQRLADKIDFIETGAAPMMESDMRLLCDILPHTRLYNTYASTETGIIATHNYNAGYCVAGCLGTAMKNSHISISDGGFIVCRGRTLMSGYWNDPGLTSSILYDNALHTRDLGIMDEQGRLHLKGREGDVLNVGGYKVSPEEVEQIVMSVPGISDCILISVPHRIFGNVLKLLLVVSSSSAPPQFKAIAELLASRLEPHKVPQLYEYVDSINRTFNGKLDRKSYVLDH